MHIPSSWSRTYKSQDVGRCGPAWLPATAVLQKAHSKHLPQPVFYKWASNVQPTKSSGFCRAAFFLYPSLCIGGSRRRADHRHRALRAAAAAPSLPPGSCSPRRLLPPSCSPRRPLTHSGDAELRKIRGAALPPYLPALRASHFPPSLPCSPRGKPRICARVVPCAPSRSTVTSDSWRRHALRTHTVLVAPGHRIFSFPASLCLHGSRTGMSATGCQASIGCLDPA